MKIRRPGFAPDYGISADEEGRLPWEWADARLGAAHNYWIATGGSAGPNAAPVWGLWLGDVFVFSTNPTSRKGRDLAADPRIVVHLESGDEVVILQGSAEPLEPALHDRVRDEYEQKYGMRLDPDEGWFQLRPSRGQAWRESDYPTSATRYDF